MSDGPLCGPPRYDEGEPEQDPCGKPATRRVIYVNSTGHSVQRPTCGDHPTYAEVGSHSFQPLLPGGELPHRVCGTCDGSRLGEGPGGTCPECVQVGMTLGAFGAPEPRGEEPAPRGLVIDWPEEGSKVAPSSAEGDTDGTD